MKDFPGTPGTLTGLGLRILQCIFAASSITAMATTSSFFDFTAFWHLYQFLGWYEKHSLAVPVLCTLILWCCSLIFPVNYCYLIASMGLQVVWSFGLALVDAYALVKKDVLNHSFLISLFVVGDWVTAILSLAAASATAGIIVLLTHDLKGNHCLGDCQQYQVSVVLAFLSWITIATSSLIMLWLVAAG